LHVAFLVCLDANDSYVFTKVIGLHTKHTSGLPQLLVRDHRRLVIQNINISLFAVDYVVIVVIEALEVGS
jgi:hypothetical protein